MHQKIIKFLSYYKPYMRVFYADMACALMVSFITLSLPFCIRHITKNLLDISHPHALRDIYLMGLLMLILLAIYTACEAFVSYKGHIMGALMESDIRHDLFDHYQKLSFSFYDDHKTGELMSRITNDSFDISELYHHGPEDIVISIMNFIGAFIILMSINMKLALVALSFLPIMLLYGYYFSTKMYAALKKSRDNIGDINNQVEDSLSGIRVVQSFTNEDIEKTKFSLANQKFMHSRKDGYKNETYFYTGMQTLTQLMMIVVVIYGAINIVKKDLDLADLLTFLLYIGILIEPIKRLGNFIRLYQEGLTGFERIMAILAIDPKIKDAPHARDIDNIKGNIEFKNVSFKYKPNYPHILHDLSINIKAGEYIALVGSSGAGKSTLCSLIPRFYEVCAGSILIDGKNINDITKKSLRKHIGIVHQDTYLFADTVLANIRYAKPMASEDEIINAAKDAHAHDFIMALPQGYNTDIGQRGIKLSGGQKQRLSIARVFLKNPPIIIFDEGTSALDNESEQAIQHSLAKLTANRTTIIIAHRLSTIRHAQKILVLNNNTIIEEGKHDDLINLHGYYAHLYNIKRL